jgi:hypothetical protein
MDANKGRQRKAQKQANNIEIQCEGLVADSQKN